MTDAPLNIQEIRSRLEPLHAASYGWALSCCSRDIGMAEDVLQRVYLKILEEKARFDGRSSLKTWLFAVIRKTAAEERRRRMVYRFRFFHLEHVEKTATGDSQIHESIEQKDLQQIFQKALLSLPKRQREVLHLVFYQDMTVEEVAGVLEISLGSARTHYERGKRQLRERLEQSREFHETRTGRRDNPAAVPAAQTNR